VGNGSKVRQGCNLYMSCIKALYLKPLKVQVLSIGIKCASTMLRKWHTTLPTLHTCKTLAHNKPQLLNTPLPRVLQVPQAQAQLPAPQERGGRAPLRLHPRQRLP
jgi:hypothetical protein